MQVAINCLSPNIIFGGNMRKVVGIYKARENVDKYAYLARLEEIKENDFNLKIPRYVDTYEEEAETDLSVVLVGRKALKEQLEKMEMEGYLVELGYA